jgi:microcystin-dependent protein
VPRFSRPGLTPSTGNAATEFRFAVDYTSLDRKPAAWIGLQIRTYSAESGWQRHNWRKTSIAAGSRALWRIAVGATYPGTTRFDYRLRAMKGRGPCRLYAMTEWATGPALAGQGGAQEAVVSVAAVPTHGGGVQVAFRLAAPAEVTVGILNVAGRRVAVLSHGRLCPAGSNSLLWNAQADNGLRVPTGTYLISLTARSGDGQQNRRLAPVSLTR